MVCYRAAYSFTEHSHLLSHTRSLQKNQMETWHLERSIRGSERVIYLVVLSCFLSLLGQISSNGMLKPPTLPGYVIQLLRAATGETSPMPWSAASLKPDMREPKPLYDVGSLLGAGPVVATTTADVTETLPKSSAHSGGLRQMAVLGDEVTEEAAGVLC